MKAMDKHGLRRPVSEELELDTSAFYEDRETWAHGLFSFSGDFGGFRDDGKGWGDSWDRRRASVISYLLWRRWNNVIILLSGIPEVLFVTRRQPRAGPGSGGVEHLAG